ncbi:hypothetical protein BKA70DRAFT_1107456, partial [Coprinopsis sp. MPI-PUGE-AT-0042]
VAPGDSVSQVPSPRPLQREVRPAERPDHLVPEVLWHIRDCAHDSQVQPSLANGNSSRPCMKKALRKVDGTLVDDTKYQHIQEDSETRCMTWYKSYHRATWDNVVHQLETMHEILQLCAGNWKAEHMISAHLHSLSSVERSRARGAGNKSSKSSSGRDGGKEKGKGKAKSSGAADSDAEASTEEVDEVGENSKPQDGPGTGEGFDIGNGTAQDLLDPSSFQPPAPTPTINTLSKPKPPSKRARSPSSTLYDSSAAGSEPKKSRSNTAYLNLTTSPVDNLRIALASDFPRILLGNALVDRLEELAQAGASNPHFPSTPSSPAFNAFVARIECADPNDPSIDEDETNQSWGHQQFTRNGNLDSAAPSWEAVGNVEAACKLIAAALKTSRVARYICTQRKVHASSYTADAYVDRVVDVLWGFVKPPETPKQVCSFTR